MRKVRNSAAKPCRGACAQKKLLFVRFSNNKVGMERLLQGLLLKAISVQKAVDALCEEVAFFNIHYTQLIKSYSLAGGLLLHFS